MAAGLMNHPKRVSFNEGTLFVVHPIELLDEGEIQDLFYHDEDYERFRYERNREIERSIRKQLHKANFVRATRRSSIDLMSQSPIHRPTTQTPMGGPLPDTAVMQRRQPRRTGHNSACWRETPVPRPPNSRTFLRSSYTSGVAFAA